MPVRKSPVPKGYHAVTAYVRVRGADAAIAFYKKAFGAKEKFRLMLPGNRVGHAELDISGSIVMLSEEFPEYDAISPATLDGTSVALVIYVHNTDVILARAVAAGATLKMPAQDMFYGDRSGQIIDPFGHHWMINQHQAVVSPREMQRRLDQMVAASPPPSPKSKAAAKPKRRRPSKVSEGA